MNKFLYIILFCCFSVISIAQFADVNDAVGIIHRSQHAGLTGGGACFFDYNNDGWIDIFLCGGEIEDKLYVNHRGESFGDSSHLINIAPFTWNTSAVNSTDFNNDGCSDLLIATYENNQPSYVLKNNCDGTFDYFQLTAGLEGFGASTGSVLADIDQDGLVDIYLLNYILSPEFIENDTGQIVGYAHECQQNMFFKNYGDFNFQEESLQFDIGAFGCTFAGLELVINENRGMYLANDFGEWVFPNEFVVGDSSDQYQDLASEYGIDFGLYGMGIAVADFDHDLDLDIYITDIGSNILLVNEQDSFSDKASFYNVESEFADDGKLSVGWGASFIDFDNDTRQDLFVANGFMNLPEFLPNSIQDQNRMYRNLGTEFSDVSEFMNLNDPRLHRASVVGDYDNDGRQDLMVSSIDGLVVEDIPERSAKLYRNENEAKNYLKIHFGEHPFTAPKNAILFSVFAEGKEYLHYLYNGGTHASSNSQNAHVGLGEADVIDSIQVSYNDTMQRTYYAIDANQTIWLSPLSEEVEIIGCMNLDDPLYNEEATINGGCAEDFGTSISHTSADCIEVDWNGTTLANKSENHLIFSVVGISGVVEKAYQLNPQEIISLDQFTGGLYFLEIRDPLNQCQELRKIIKF